MVQKISVETSKGLREVICKNPLGKHTKKGLKLLISTQTSETDEGGALKLIEYLDYLDELTAECTGMSVDELDELDTDEKEKIIAFYNDKVQSRLDFLKSSLKSDDSAPKEKMV